jgi:hypothetical protein
LLHASGHDIGIVTLTGEWLKSNEEKANPAAMKFQNLKLQRH